MKNKWKPSEMISKDEAEYTEHPKPWQGKCRDCSMFVKPGSCTLVRGGVKPSAHCKHYDAK